MENTSTQTVAIRYKSRKLKVKARINNDIIAANARKTFIIPVAEYQGLTQIL